MYPAFGKRCLDVSGAAVALLLLSPFMALVALAIVLEDGASPLFVQERCGRDGRPFRLLKFRSMPTGTASVPSTDTARLRITRVGALIRRFNLDELPQLWNVLRGDMSLVGPRPALPMQRELLEARSANGAMQMRPGLTGLAQVSAFDGMPVAQKAQYDGLYAREVSFGKDLAIILRTFGYLLRRPPVY